MQRLILAAVMVGSVTYYAPNLMEATYEARLALGHVQPCADCIGMVALLDREHVGQRVWLQRPGRAAEGPFLVVDCAAAQHRAALRRRGLIAEVDFETAQRWGMTGPLQDVRLWFGRPAVGAAERERR